MTAQYAERTSGRLKISKPGVPPFYKRLELLFLMLHCELLRTASSMRVGNAHVGVNDTL